MVFASLAVVDHFLTVHAWPRVRVTHSTQKWGQGQGQISHQYHTIELGVFLSTMPFETCEVLGVSCFHCGIEAYQFFFFYHSWSKMLRGSAWGLCVEAKA